MQPELLNVGIVEAVGRELLLFRQPDLAVCGHLARVRLACPLDLVDGIDVLQELRETLKAIGNFARDRVQIEAAALLKVGELRDLLAVHHDLPADAPGATDRPLPVVFLELDVVIGEHDADCFKALKIQVLDAGWWRLQDHLKLGVLVEPIRVLAVTAVSRAARRLRVGDAYGLWAEHAQKGVGAHGAGADFDIEGLLQHAATLGPETLQSEEDFLKGERLVLRRG